MFAVPYSQYDPRWRDNFLGKTSLKMGKWGCYTTGVASILAGTFQKKGDDGLPLMPGEFNVKLNAINGYDADGQIKWDKLSELYPDVFLYGLVWTDNHPGQLSETTIAKATADIRNALRLGFPVGLCVDNVGNDGWPDHFVVALHWNPGAGLLITDPDGGHTFYFHEKYGDPMKKIYGYRRLIGLPAEFPDYSTDYDRKLGAVVGKAGEVFRGRNVAVYSKEILDGLLSGS
jgi:hypothetical protein